MLPTPRALGRWHCQVASVAGDLAEGPEEIHVTMVSAMGMTAILAVPTLVSA